MATTYLNKTLGSGNKDKWTFSCWVKRHSTGAIHPLFHADDGSSNYYTHISFHDTDQLFFQNRWNNGNDGYKITTRQFRDTGAWYHLQFVWDSGNATAGDRQIIYVNGERLTEFGGANVAVTQNRDTTINDGYEHRIGRGGSFNGSAYADVTMAHVHFADAQAYAPTVFGETDSTSGIWKPKTNPSVTYGTNGFFLKFANSASLGLDSSGNTNNFTVNGTGTQTIDSPSNNYPTLNRLAPSQDNRTGGNGSLYTGDNSNNSWSSHPTTMACESGKWYVEIKDESDWGSTSDSTRRYGIANLASSSLNQNRASATDVRFSDGNYGYAYMNASGVRHSGSTIAGSTSTHPTFAEGDFIMIAMDLDNRKLYFGKNGTWLDSGNPASGASGTGAVATLAAGGTWAPYLEVKYGSDTASINLGQGYFRTTVAGTNADANGQGKFKYSVPSGYYAICSKNIKEFG